MSFACKVLEIDRKIDGDVVSLGLLDKNGDEDGQRVTLVGCDDDDFRALNVGGKYSLPFVPFVAPSDTVASPVAVAALPAGSIEMVPAEHPAVIDPVAANDASAAETPAAPATEAPAAN